MATVIIHPDGDVEVQESKPVTKESVEREFDNGCHLELQLIQLDYEIEKYRDPSGVLFLKAVPPLKKKHNAKAG